MQKIEIKTNAFFVKTITKENGTLKEMRLQPALFHRGDGAVYPFDIMLDKAQPAHEAGFYGLNLTSFLPDRFGVGFRPTLGERLDAKKA